MPLEGQFQRSPGNQAALGGIPSCRKGVVPRSRGENGDRSPRQGRSQGPFQLPPQFPEASEVGELPRPQDMRQHREDLLGAEGAATGVVREGGRILRDRRSEFRCGHRPGCSVGRHAVAQHHSVSARIVQVEKARTAGGRAQRNGKPGGSGRSHSGSHRRVDGFRLLGEDGIGTPRQGPQFGPAGVHHHQPVAEPMPQATGEQAGEVRGTLHQTGQETRRPGRQQVRRESRGVGQGQGSDGRGTRRSAGESIPEEALQGIGQVADFGQIRIVAGDPEDGPHGGAQAL